MHVRLLPLLLVLALGIGPAAHARGPIQQAADPDEAGLVEHGHYLNKRGQSVHSPAHTKSGEVPKGASAQCRDGTFSFSRTHRGTCSRHGGVARWVN